MPVYLEHEVWIKQNPNGTYLQYLKEQLQIVRFCLSNPNVIKNSSEKEINELKNQEEYFSVEIYERELNEKRLEVLNNCKELWQTQTKLF